MTTTNEDVVMAEIVDAVTAGRGGEVDTALGSLERLWARIGPAGDPLHRCTLAHYLADLCPDPARALMWDVRALDAADALTDERVRQHHDSLRIARFYPSLHLNLADNFRMLGSFAAAAEHIAAARQRQHVLGDDGYGALIRQAILEVAEAIEHRSTVRRPSTGTAFSAENAVSAVS